MAKSKKPVEDTVEEKKESKYINPVLSWSLILVEIVIAAAIGAAVILPLI